MIRLFKLPGTRLAQLLLVAVLAIPGVVAMRSGAVDKEENRNLVSWPVAPTSALAWLALTGKIDGWINDHFGFRGDLVKINNRLRYFLFREFPTIQVISGRNGRIFLAAHTIDQRPYSALTNVCGDAPGVNATAAYASSIAYINRVFADFHRAGLHPHLLVIPSPPVVQSEDVPMWLHARCATLATAPANLLKSDALDLAAGANIWYPLDTMLQIKQHALIFPRHRFHWEGAGVGELARETVQRFWGLDAAKFDTLRVQARIEPSDLSGLFPGVALSDRVEEPDTAERGIVACVRGPCFPEIAGPSQKLWDISRFNNAAAPDRRLLIISDSYGVGIAPWFSPYFRHVEHFATNNMQLLTPEELKQLLQFLFRDRAHTDILLLYHDGNIVTGTMQSQLAPVHELLNTVL